MWRPRGELKDRYEVVIIGGGSHGLATAYYLAKEHGITDVAVLEQSYIGSGAAGRNTTIIRSNYRTPEGAAFYQASVEAVRAPLARARLQPPLLPARPPHARAQRPRHDHVHRARRGEPAARDRQPRDLAGGDRPALPRARPLAGRHLADPGRPLPPARRDHPARRRRLGLRARRRPRRRRDPPVHRGDGDRARERPRHGRADDAREDRVRDGRQRHRRLVDARRRHGRRCGCRSRRTSSRPSSPSR